MSRLALGTAQFGLNYGIANKCGQVTKFQTKAILRLLMQRGIDMLDTAIAYGESESCLGEIGVENFQIITKLPLIPEDCVDVVSWIKEQIQASFKRLKVKQIYGLLLHRPNQLLTNYGKAIYQALQELKAIGQVQKIGVSIYNPEELKALISQYKLDLVQAPFNLVDRRLQRTGWLQRLKDNDIEVHCRSIFLQGLLLLAKHEFPAKFAPWWGLWNKWQDWLEHSSVSAIQACLLFPLSFAEIDRVVVGVDNVSQLEEIIVLTKCNNSIAFPDLSCEEEKFISPIHW
jgi:aryl-alcohol dehydrogenase-like predicted oxidoreductase